MDFFNFIGPETNFAPLPALGGGALIGLSAVILMATLGRIMGITGILNASLSLAALKNESWRIALLLGIISSPFAAFALWGFWPSLNIQFTTFQLIIGGLLVGFGAALGGGCTSGHGICGNARFSKRSIIATLTFMTITILTVFITRHVITGGAL